MTVGMTEQVSTSNHIISDIFKEKLVIDWDCDDVYSWLNNRGFKHYANLIAYEHNVDGMVLLSLKEADLRNPPLALTRLGDIKKLCKAFAELRSSLVSRMNHSKTSDSDTPPIVLSDEDTSSWLFHPPYVKENSFTLQNGGVVENIHERQITTTATNLQNDKQFKMITKEELIRRIESPDTQAKSLIKLLLAFIYCSLSLLITSFVMVVVHDRVPDMKSYPPLPDLILDNIPLIPWAFEACEFIGVIMTTIMATVLIFHKHRVVITRRMFSVVGTVFLLRCITMFVTSLSVPGSHLECSAKTFGSLKDQLYQAYHIWSHMGMSIQGVRTCGDYMFSGHTTVITLLNHFITEYTDESWYGLHTTSWVLNLFGMFFILAGHEHYSIDVFIAFYISSRMFLYYHAYAYNHSNITSTDSRMRVWYPLAWFFESGGLGRVPNEFSEPFSLTIPTWRSGKKDDEMIFVEEHNVQEAFEIRKKKN